MWGSLIGAGVSIIGNSIASREAGKAAEKAHEADMQLLAQQQHDNAQQYRYNLASSRAMVDATLSQGYKKMSDAIGNNRAVGAVMGDESGRQTAQLQEAAMKEMSDKSLEASKIKQEAAMSANNQYYANKKALIDSQRKSESDYYNGISQQSQIAAQGFSNLGSAMFRADMQGHLDNGKGLFEQAFSKK